MQGVYLGIIGPVMAVAFASFVIYDEERLRASRFALGIILLASVLLPISSAVKGVLAADFGYSEEGVDSSFVEKTVEEAFAEGVARAVCEEFSLKPSEVSVEALGFDSERMTAETIRLTLSGRAASANYAAIEDFINGSGLGKCVLEVRFG